MNKSGKGHIRLFIEDTMRNPDAKLHGMLFTQINCPNVTMLIQLEEERKRISEELSILNNIKHPNIISFINAWVSKNKSEVIFITEIVHGGSLKK